MKRGPEHPRMRVVSEPSVRSMTETKLELHRQRSQRAHWARWRSREECCRHVRCPGCACSRVKLQDRRRVAVSNEITLGGSREGRTVALAKRCCPLGVGSVSVSVTVARVGKCSGRRGRLRLSLWRWHRWQAPHRAGHCCRQCDGALEARRRCHRDKRYSGSSVSVIVTLVAPCCQT